MFFKLDIRERSIKIYTENSKLNFENKYINFSKIDGVIVSNTSNNQELKNELNVGSLPGGISGLAIKNKSNELLKFVKKNLNEEKILVAVGGVFDVDSYNEKIEMGADLVQMYTGLVYQGPNQVRRIVKNGR